MATDNIVDLQKLREEKTLDSFWREVHNRPPLLHDLRLTKKHIEFFIGGFGGNTKAEDFVRTLFVECSTGVFSAALELSRNQWEEFRVHVDGHFEALESARNRSSKEGD